MLLKAEFCRWKDSWVLAEAARSVCLGDFDEAVVGGAVGGRAGRCV